MPDVVIVGGGQAGLSAGACLARNDIDHVVVDRGKIGDSWRRQRWDSFCLVTPNWTLRLPGYKYIGTNPDGFMSGREFIKFAYVSVGVWCMGKTQPRRNPLMQGRRQFAPAQIGPQLMHHQALWHRLRDSNL